MIWFVALSASNADITSEGVRSIPIDPGDRLLMKIIPDLAHPYREVFSLSIAMDEGSLPLRSPAN